MSAQSCKSYLLRALCEWVADNGLTPYLALQVDGQTLFFFSDTATTEIYTLSLHDALPISNRFFRDWVSDRYLELLRQSLSRSEEHTSELQSRGHLVCRLLLEKKNPPIR